MLLAAAFLLLTNNRAQQDSPLAKKVVTEASRLGWQETQEHLPMERSNTLIRDAFKSGSRYLQVEMYGMDKIQDAFARMAEIDRGQLEQVRYNEPALVGTGLMLQLPKSPNNDIPDGKERMAFHMAINGVINNDVVAIHTFVAGPSRGNKKHMSSAYDNALSIATCICREMQTPYLPLREEFEKQIGLLGLTRTSKMYEPFISDEKDRSKELLGAGVKVDNIDIFIAVQVMPDKNIQSEFLNVSRATSGAQFEIPSSSLEGNGVHLFSYGDELDYMLDHPMPLGVGAYGIVGNCFVESHIQQDPRSATDPTAKMKAVKALEKLTAAIAKEAARVPASALN